MDTQKGVRRAAVGFLFTLVNININFGDSVLDLMPDFVGWILLTMACDLLADYLRNETWLRPLAIGLAVLHTVRWVCALIPAEIAVVNLLAGIGAAVFMFFFFGGLERIAQERGSQRLTTLTTLKYLNAIVYILLALFGMLAGRIDLGILAVAVVVLGVVALIAAICTAVVLFGFSKELAQADAQTDES